MQQESYGRPLGENGRSLYVSDAANYPDSFYTISDKGREPIHERIAEISSFYRFQPHP